MSEPDRVPIDEALDSPEKTVVVAAAPPTHKASASQIVTLILGVVALLYFGRPILLPIALAWALAMTLKPIVRWLGSKRVPRHLGAALVLGVVLAGVGFCFVEMGKPTVAWVQDAPEHVRQLRQRMQKIFSGVPKISQAFDAVASFGASEEAKDEEAPKTVAVKPDSHAGSVLSWTGTLLASIAETIVLLYLILATGDALPEKMVRVSQSYQEKRLIVDIVHELQRSISNYVFTVTLINLGAGLVAGLGFWAIGIPNPAMWGMAVAVLNFIPYMGPIAGIFCLGVVGILSFDTLTHGLMAAGWYLLIHAVESNFVTPILLGRRFTLNPVVIFVSLLFWTWLWGIPGAILSLPLLLSMKIVCERVPPMKPLAELLNR